MGIDFRKAPADQPDDYDRSETARHPVVRPTADGVGTSEQARLAKDALVHPMIGDVEHEAHADGSGHDGPTDGVADLFPFEGFPPDQARLAEDALIHPMIGDVEHEADADGSGHDGPADGVADLFPFVGFPPDQVRLADDALVHPMIGDVEHEADADGSGHDGPADERADRFIVETFKSFTERVLEAAAAAHGLLPTLKLAELLVVAAEERRAAEGEGTLEVSVPISLGLGVDLEVTVHPGHDQGGLRLGVRYVPSDGSAVGVAQIGLLEVGFGSEPEGAVSQSGPAAEVDVAVFGRSLQSRGLEHQLSDDVAAGAVTSYSDVDVGVLNRMVEIIAVRLSPEEGVSSGPVGPLALKLAAQQELPRLRSQLRGHGPTLAVLWDAASGRVLSLRLAEGDDAPESIWSVRIEMDPGTGRFSKPQVRHTKEGN